MTDCWSDCMTQSRRAGVLGVLHRKEAEMRKSKNAMKFRLYRSATTLAMIAVLVEALGAGRRF
jgi:hypothetical protein